MVLLPVLPPNHNHRHPHQFIPKERFHPFFSRQSMAKHKQPSILAWLTSSPLKPRPPTSPSHGHLPNHGNRSDPVKVSGTQSHEYYMGRGKLQGQLLHSLWKRHSGVFLSSPRPSTRLFITSTAYCGGEGFRYLCLGYGCHTLF